MVQVKHPSATKWKEIHKQEWITPHKEDSNINRVHYTGENRIQHATTFLNKNTIINKYIWEMVTTPKCVRSILLSIKKRESVCRKDNTCFLDTTNTKIYTDSWLLRLEACGHWRCISTFDNAGLPTTIHMGQHTFLCVYHHDHILSCHLVPSHLYHWLLLPHLPFIRPARPWTLLFLVIIGGLWILARLT